VLLICLIGCANPQPGATHVVLCWLKSPGDSASRQQLIDTSYTFGKIPGVVSVTAGHPLPSTRPVVDSSFDVAVVMQFKNEQALRAYEQHPIHKKAVSDVLRPLTAKILIYDIQTDASSSLTKR
jgi:hypothetical protein